MQLQGNINIDKVLDCGSDKCNCKIALGCLKTLSNLQAKRIKEDSKTIEYLREEVKYWMKQSSKKT